MAVDKRAIHKSNRRSPRDSGFGIGDSKNSAVIPGPTQGAGHGAAPAFPNPQSRIPNPVKSICVYCGSNAALRPAYAAQAQALGTRISTEGLALVSGGANVGLMGSVGETVSARGSGAIGA